jgi:dTDP-4-amino-4,6-dideoxygalactose transaminase
MIPVFDLKRQYNTIKKELNTAFTQTAKNGSFILGKNVSQFEKEFAGYVGAPHAVGLGSGTDALTLGLKSLGVGVGDEVILPANSYPSAFGVALSGATIRLVDVKDDGTMNPAKLHGAITRRTRALIAVHLYGNPADVVSIQKIIRNKKIFLVEDAAQAHGTKGAGAVGDIGCFSFYPSKNLGALGDAGMVVTKSSRISERLKKLRMYGERVRYASAEVSGTSRLDELQAAFLRVKLKHLNRWVVRRREIAKRYIKGLTKTGDLRFVTSPGSSHHLFVIRTKYRDELQQYLTRKKIGTAIHYPIPIHLVRSFRSLGYHTGDFPVSEALSREMLSIPMFPELTDHEVFQVMRAIKTFFGEGQTAS